MVSNSCKILGENIKKLRKSRGLTQNKLAELLGVEVKSLSLIETGKGFISAKTLDKITSILNVDLEDLFSAIDSKKAENIYTEILSNLKILKTNSQKLQTVNLVVKSLI